MFVAYPVAWILGVLMHHKPLGLNTKAILFVFLPR